MGTLLTFIWSASPGMTAAFAVVGGLTCGTLINALFGWVRGSESGALLGEAGYVGFVGRMTLPIRGGTPGKLVVERAGRRIELRALPHPSAKGNPADWKDVFVVEMEKGVARVAPFDEDMLLKP